MAKIIESRARSWRLEILAPAVFILNIFDGVFTIWWYCSRTATGDLNPFMDGLLRADVILFFLSKVTLVGLGLIFLWRKRTLPLAKLGIILVFLVYGAIFLLHVWEAGCRIIVQCE